MLDRFGIFCGCCNWRAIEFYLYFSVVVSPNIWFHNSSHVFLFYYELTERMFV